MTLCGPAIVFLFFVGSVFADDTPVYREITCRVVDENDVPVTGVKVQLRGMDRDALGINPDDTNSERCRGWTFQEGAGGFTARFGKFRQYDHQQATGLIEPGYGRFYFVVEKEGWAGGVSAAILNLNDEDRATLKKATRQGHTDPEEGEEWRGGERVLSDREDEPLKIVLRRGVAVNGRMLDTAGRPVSGESVSVLLDLHSGSHTGHGGEIFEQQATTDAAGRFHFERVYPNTFFVEMLNDSRGPPYWVRTRVRQRWVDKIADEITPRVGRGQPCADETSIDLRLVVSREPPYRYFGRVTDLNGHGVAGALVEIRCSLHEPARTFEDDHDYWWKTTTDRHGDYSVRVGSRFANAFWVTAGNLVGAYDTEEDDLKAPGRYDITVRPK